MTSCEKYKVLKVEELEKSIIEDNRDIYQFDEQLSNSCFVYYLENGEVILLPSSLKGEHLGLTISDKNCLQSMIRKDEFPIENPNKHPFQLEIENIKKINNKVFYYQNWLNQQGQEKYSTINIDVLNAYYNQLKLKRKKSNLSHKDYVAFGTLVSDYLITQNNAKWVLYKRYGMYNPYYEPCILNVDNTLNFLFPRIWTYIDSDFESFDGFFKLYKALPNNVKIENLEAKIETGLIIILD